MAGRLSIPMQSCESSIVSAQASYYLRCRPTEIDAGLRRATQLSYRQTPARDGARILGVAMMILPTKVLVLQAWGIGDMVMTTPMLSSLRAAFPQATVTLMAGSTAALEVVDTRLYDDALVMPKNWRRPVTAIRTFAALRPSQFDAAVTATRLSPWYAAFLRWISGIPVVAGDGPAGRWSAHTHRVSVNTDEHRIISNNRILGLLVPNSAPGPLGVAVAARDNDEAAGIWRDSGLEGAQVLAVHPGSDPNEGLDKRPDPSVMREVIRQYLGANPNRKAAVFFGPMDMNLLAEYSDLGPRVRLFRDIPLKTVIPLLARCDIMAGGDAALGHIAAARGVPTLTLAGPTLISTTRPWGARNAVITTQESLECMPCYGTPNYGRCPYGTRCMRGIEPRAVIAQIELLLRSSPAETGRP